MWGHSQGCSCPVCSCLPRLFVLIRIGVPHPSWTGWVADRLRVVEAEFRDELQRLGPPQDVVPPPGEARVDPTPRESQEPATAPTPTGPSEPVSPGLLTTPKGRPPSPPNRKAPPGKPGEELQIKEEPPASPKGSRQGVIEVAEEVASSPKRSKSAHRRRRGDTEEKDRSRRRRRSEEKKSKRKRKSRSDSRKRSRSRRRAPERGRSRKRREERPREPSYPPPVRRWERPPEPAHPPPGHGWRGYLPVSDHPRWSESTNKGQVKRAKQEIYNRRPHRR